jgi:hypothetical protein
VIVCAVMLMMMKLSPAAGEADRDLKIAIPESLDYSSLFDDLMDQYTSASALINVKTTNLGSLYRLHYHIQLPVKRNLSTTCAAGTEIWTSPAAASPLRETFCKCKEELPFYKNISCRSWPWYSL